MAKKKSNILVGGLLLLGAGLLIKSLTGSNSNNSNDDSLEESTESTPVLDEQTQTVVNQQVTVYLDGNKLLKKGSKGAEVRKLQQLLKVAVDGDFGNITENALFSVKGVKQITLNQFNAKPNSNVSSVTNDFKYSIGEVLRINKSNGLNAQEWVKDSWNGKYKPTVPLQHDFLENGEEVGEVVMLMKIKSTNKKLYLIKNDGLLYDKYYLISEQWLK